MSSPAQTLPAAGLYRTLFAHPNAEHARAVPGGVLVYFHPTSEQGPPLVALPEGNAHNAWSFSRKGFLIPETSWCATLSPLPPQGYYVASSDLVLQNGQKLPQGMLVQLGYTRQAQPIVFPSRHDAEANAIVFAEQGALITDLQLLDLAPLPFRMMAPAKG